MKKLKWLAVIVLVLIVIVIGVIVLSVDGIIKSVVQTQASSSLNLPTTLGAAHLSILGGSLTLDDLNVGSPQGFSAPQIFSLGSAGVSVSYGQLRNNPVKIETITLDKPKVVIEQANGKLNIQALQSQPSSAPPPDSKGGQTMKLIIDKLTITGADVTIRPGIDLPDVPKEINLSIPAIDLQNIGNSDGSQNGAAIKDVLSQVLTAIQQKASESSNLPPAVKAILSGNMNAVTDQLKQQANKMLDAAKTGNPDTIKSAGKNAQNALNGLLGGKSK